MWGSNSQLKRHRLYQLSPPHPAFLELSRYNLCGHVLRSKHLSDENIQQSYSSYVLPKFPLHSPGPPVLVSSLHLNEK